MFGIINNFDFGEMEVMKYYAPPASWDTEKKKKIVKDRIFSGEWLAAEKKDGFFGKFIKDEDGNLILYSRSRNVNKEFVNKINWVPHLHSFFESLPNGTCFLGELYLPKQPGSKCVQTILGCLESKAITRQETGEKINFYIFDCLAYDGINYINKGYAERIKIINEIVINNEYVQGAKYFRGTELWSQLQKILLNGGEGMVIIHENAPYEPAKRPSKTTLKVKKEIKETIDVFFTGRASAPTKEYTGKEIENWQYWINFEGERLPIKEHYYEVEMEGKPYTAVTKPYYFKWAGSLEIAVMDGEKIHPIGYISGLTDEIKMNYKDYKNKVIEIGAMEIMQDTLALRHGKMLGFRDDKIYTECTIDQLKSI